MGTYTDCLGLGGSNFSNVIKKSLECSKGNPKTRNIIDCNEDILYAWNQQDSCLIAKNLRSTQPEEPSVQRLLLTDPPVFDVDRVTVNATGSRVALSGTRGVTVLQLPRRWGPGANFHGGKESISCRSHSLDERYFLCSPNVLVQQVRWHPGSPTDSHLLVLTSENTFRLYVIGTPPSHDLESAVWLQAVWAVGRTPSSAIASHALPFLVGLGDTAVDFDFASPEEAKREPPTPGAGTAVTALAQLAQTPPRGATQQGDTSGIVWPILVLRGNGDVYLVTASLDVKSRRSEADRSVYVEGPLPMFPQAADNYGSDACAIICPSRLVDPPVVVIASCSGALYHCLLIKSNGDYDEGNQSLEPEDVNVKAKLDAVGEGRTSSPSPWSSRRGSTYSLQETCVALHAFECVEIELGLSLAPSSGPEGVDEVDTSLPCPIHLHHDPSTDSRYFCSHDTGVHAVSLPIIPQLLKAAHSKEDEDLDMPALSHESSSAEYLICTRTTSQALISSSEQVQDEKINPVFGLCFSIHQPPSSLICLLSTGEVVSLPLTTVYLPPIPVTEDSTSVSSLLPPPPLPALSSHSGGTAELTGKLLREPFDSQIKKFLKPQNTQPILKLCPEANPTPQECLELLGRATQLYREEYIKRHDRAREEAEKRVRTLTALKNQQLEEITRLEDERENLSRAAEALAEKYEDAKEKQDMLAKRAGNLLRLATLKQPVISYAEKQASKELKSTENKVTELLNALEKVKTKQSYQQMQIEQWTNTEGKEGKKAAHLSDQQIQAIKDTFVKKNEDLNFLKDRIDRILQELGM
ncbi:nuclear pore complex protein Nup88 [Ischnura elegans]|uniref:nuclear pore complex protein Nup88 n=1 Tax=Ischnura elegans TaxID=197161 RepID=UPI001ED88EEB|nr:nuclear pore complex protein Nup88 [Ischnura elegans]